MPAIESSKTRVDVGDGLQWNVKTFNASGDDAPTVVALHGFTGSGLDFKPLFEAMPSRWILPDVLGHGASDAPADPAPYAMPAVAAQLAVVIDQMVSGPYTLLGYSMGARLALSVLLGELPADVPRPAPNRLILVGGTPGIDEADERAKRQETDGAIAEGVREHGVDWFCEHWSKVPILQSQRNIEPGFREGMERRRRSLSADGLCRSLEGLGTGAMPSLWPKIGDLDIPTMLITGSEDAKFSDVAERMVAANSNIQHRMMDAIGHTAHLEAPRRFARAADF